MNLKESTPYSVKIKGWFKAARPPFHSVGVLPVIVGAIFASKLYGYLNWPVLIWSIIAVILVMLSTYLNGEYHDMKEDEISGSIGKSAFAGGSQSMFDGSVKHSSVKIAGYISIILAMLIGLLLQFYFKTGVWTIPLGVTGVFFGFFYSKPPLRLVNSGLGEIAIGFCYGWLPVVIGFYLQTGFIANNLHLISLPIACTIFNVILINEFPDYPADVIAKKRNLTVRYGMQKASYIYITATILSWIFFLLTTKENARVEMLLYFLPIFLIELVLIFMVAKKMYLNRKILEVICGLTIVSNLGTSILYIILILNGYFQGSGFGI
jgi:1,4-dihydroxy-2-naphthoate polyprenyltransferase